MSSGQRTKSLLIQVLEHSGRFRPLTPINRQVALLFALFEADGPWRSRIIEGLKGRAGGLTETRLRERAHKLNLLPTESPWKRNTDPQFQSERLTRNRCDEAGDDGDYISRLRAMRRNAFGADAEVLDWILSRLGP